MKAAALCDAVDFTHEAILLGAMAMVHMANADPDEKHRARAEEWLVRYIERKAK